MLSLSLDLGSSLVVVTQVASLAHAHGVEQSVLVLTFSGVLVSAELSIARGAHVLSVVLSVGVRALGDGHHSSLLNFIGFTRLLWGVIVLTVCVVVVTAVFWLVLVFLRGLFL